MIPLFDFAEFKDKGALPSPSGVGLAILRLSRREGVALDAFVQVIMGDPVLAGHLIRLGNVLRPIGARPLAAVSVDVLLLIGIEQVRQLAISFSLAKAYRTGACSAFDYDGFWSRAVGMACMAQALGTPIRLAPSAELFTCGLLSNIGRLGLASVFPARYSSILSTLAAHADLELLAAESRHFGIDHYALSADMMADWGLPRLFCDAVRQQHRSAEQAQMSEQVINLRQQRLRLLLELAGDLADLYLHADAPPEQLPQTLQDRALVLAIDAGALLQGQERAIGEWREWIGPMQLRPPHPPLRPLPAEE